MFYSYESMSNAGRRKKRESKVRPNLGRPRTTKTLARPRLLGVYLEDAVRAGIDRSALEAGIKKGKAVSVSEYVRAALEVAAERQADVFAKLGI